MKKIILLRHAKSSWADASLPDFERPLNSRGTTIAPAMGKFLRSQCCDSDIILASTALRVRETLEGLLPEWHCSAEVLWEKSLYLATLSTLESYMWGLHDSWSTAMLVGHNPGLSDLASKLASQELYLPTCAIAIFESSAVSWSQFFPSHCKCVAVWKPKEIFLSQ